MDVLNALSGESLPDDGSLTDFALFREIVIVLRASLDAPSGHLPEVMRRRGIEVADTLDVLQYVSSEEPIDSYDLVADGVLFSAIGHRFVDEVHASAEHANYSGFAETIGRRVLAHQAREQQRILMATSRARDLLTSRRSRAEHRALVDRVLAGDVTVAAALEEMEDAPSRAQVVGRWICDSLYDAVVPLVGRNTTAPPDDSIATLAVPAGEALAAWILDATPVDLSTRTRARRARAARVCATLGMAALLNVGQT